MIIRNYNKLLSKLREGTIYKANNFHLSAFDAASKQKVIAIRREDQSVWERRAPLGILHSQTI
jgi:hypothetical protein